MQLVVNGEAVDDAEVRQEAENMRPRYYEEMQGGDPISLEMQLRDWARENVIERILLRQEAALRGISVEQLIEGINSKIAPPKHKEAGDYYQRNKEQFWIPEMVHAAHIIRNVNDATDEETARAAIQKVKEELDQGGRFEDLADRYSDCAGNGGDLGWFPRGQMVEEFDDVVFAMQPQQVSDVFRTVFGFHIARLIERSSEGIPGFAQVREQIEAMLLSEKRQRAIEAFIDSLKAHAKIEKRHESVLRT